MNERIKELAEQAHGVADEIFDRQGKMYGEIVMEKFAELIVGECLKIAIEEERHAPFEGPVETKIRQHFGVEV
jgi:hypothetical protein